jgi:hypothetical protein
MKLENLKKAVIIHQKLEALDNELSTIEQDESLFQTVAVIRGLSPGRVKELQQEAKLLLLAEKSLLFDQAKALD